MWVTMAIQRGGPASRLQIRQGTLVLAYPTFTPLSGTLLELNEQSCRGTFTFEGIAPEVEREWKNILQPKRPLHIRIDVPPYLQDFELDGTISTVHPKTGSFDIDLSFHQVGATNLNILSQAILTLATERVRYAAAYRTGNTNMLAPDVPAGAESGLVPAAPAPPAPAPLVPPPPPPPRLTRRPVPPAPPAPHAQPQTQAPVPPAPVARQIQPAPPAVPPAPAVQPAWLVDDSDLKEMAPAPEPTHQNGPVDTIPAPEPPPRVLLKPDKEPESAILADPHLMRAAMTMPTDASQRPPSVNDTQNLKTKRLGEVLIHMGRLTPDQVASAVRYAKGNGERLGRYLLRTGMVAPDALCRALALQTGMPMTDLSEAEIPEALARVFPHEMMVQHSFVPFDDSKAFVCVAVADPLPMTTQKELEKLCGKRIEMFLAQEDLVVRTLDKLRGKQKRKLRRHIRYEVNALVRYQFCSRLGHPAEDVIHNGTTLNISEGGFLIEGSPTALGSPDDLRRRGICCRVVLTGTFQEISTLCHLRSIRARERQEAGKARWLLGLEVAEIAADDRRRLKELCLKAVAEKVRESE